MILMHTQTVPTTEGRKCISQRIIEQTYIGNLLCFWIHLALSQGEGHFLTVSWCGNRRVT